MFQEICENFAAIFYSWMGKDTSEIWTQNRNDKYMNANLSGMFLVHKLDN